MTDNKKQVIFEITLYIIFFISNLVLYRGIIYFNSFWLSFTSISFIIILNISLLGFYSTIETSKSNTVLFILLHAFILFSFLLLYGFSLLNISIIGIVIILMIILLGSYLRKIDIEIKERLRYDSNRIIFPHIKQVILCFMIVITGSFYIKMYNFYDESKAEIKLSDTVIKSQIKLLEPIIKRGIPNFTEESTVGEIIEGNVQKNLNDQNKLISESIKSNLKKNPSLKNVNLDKIDLDTKLTIESQIEEINTQLELEDKIDYETNVVIGLGQILNNFIQEFINKFLDSNKFALILSGLFFSVFSILIPIYGLIIKYIVLLLEKLSFELDFVKIKSVTKQKDTITY